MESKEILLQKLHNDIDKMSPEYLNTYAKTLCEYVLDMILKGQRPNDTNITKLLKTVIKI